MKTKFATELSTELRPSMRYPHGTIKKNTLETEELEIACALQQSFRTFPLLK